MYIIITVGHYKVFMREAENTYKEKYFLELNIFNASQNRIALSSDIDGEMQKSSSFLMSSL
jgi:hypothetical protein